MNEALRAALLLGRRRPRVRGAGSPTQFRGDGYEFVELREYVPGDDPRRIDWAATARSGALQTRVVLEDVALTLGIIVDDSASMQAGRTRSLLEAAREAEDTWKSVASRDDRIVVIPSVANVHERSRGTDGTFNLEYALRAALAILPRGAALLLITDAFDLGQSLDSGCSDRAAYARDDVYALGEWCDCTLLLARDPWRQQLPLRGFARVRDLETQSTKTVYVGARERERYRRAVEQREGEITERFVQARWRVGTLHEGDGRASLYETFGLPHRGIAGIGA